MDNWKILMVIFDALRIGLTGPTSVRDRMILGYMKSYVSAKKRRAKNSRKILKKIEDLACHGRKFEHQIPTTNQLQEMADIFC